MKKYQYVNYKIGRRTSDKEETHNKIIDKYAELGYRYVGYFPTNMFPNGAIKEVDLIFEIDE